MRRSPRAPTIPTVALLATLAVGACERAPDPGPVDLASAVDELLAVAIERVRPGAEGAHLFLLRRESAGELALASIGVGGSVAAILEGLDPRGREELSRALAGSGDATGFLISGTDTAPEIVALHPSLLEQELDRLGARSDLVARRGELGVAIRESLLEVHEAERRLQRATVLESESWHRLDELQTRQLEARQGLALAEARAGGAEALRGGTGRAEREWVSAELRRNEAALAELRTEHEELGAALGVGPGRGES